jgi:hypothetical protein
MGDVKGFLKHGRETPTRRSVPVRLRDWKEVYEPFPDDHLATQASRCMDCGIPFCNDGCPLGNLIPDWNAALFINDNVATQIDGLGHITTGSDNSWYNGFKEADWGGNFGIRKADATTIPPIIARGVLIDLAGLKNVEALPGNYAITIDDLQQALRRQQTQLKPGDIVLIRTGTLRYWGEAGSDHARIGAHDSA